MWGSTNCEFAFKPSKGRSSGLLTMLDNHQGSNVMVRWEVEELRGHVLWLDFNAIRDEAERRGNNSEVIYPPLHDRRFTLPRLCLYE